MANFEEHPPRLNDARHPCRVCGRPLAYRVAFNKFGKRIVEACSHCRLQWHNNDAPIAIEVSNAEGNDPAK